MGESMVDRIGQQFGNYRLIQLLGRGGFAEVYLGEHIRLGTQAAIKVLHTQLSSREVERFLNEARFFGVLTALANCRLMCTVMDNTYTQQVRHSTSSLIL